MSESGEERPSAINFRYEFTDYADVRRFLDDLAELSKRDGFYPDIGFGKDYANITFDADSRADLVRRNSDFLKEMERLANKNGAK